MEKIQQDIIILNVYAPSTRTTKFIKETLLWLKSHIVLHTLMMLEDVNNTLSPIVTRQKLNREVLELADITNQMDLTCLQNISHKHERIYILLLIKPSPKLTTYMGTKQVSTYTRKLK